MDTQTLAVVVVGLFVLLVILGEVAASWNLGGALIQVSDLVCAADLMQIRVDYLRELGHPDAEKDTAIVASLRAIIAEQNS